MIAGRRAACFFLLANPQAFGRDGYRVRISVGALKQFGCFHHSRRNPILSRRALLRESFAHCTQAHAGRDTGGEKFSLTHFVHTISSRGGDGPRRFPHNFTFSILRLSSSGRMLSPRIGGGLAMIMECAGNSRSYSELGAGVLLARNGRSDAPSHELGVVMKNGRIAENLPLY